MPRDKVFVSYSHTDKAFLDELLPVLKAVPRIANNLWLDEQKIDVGDSFHPEIQQGLAASRVGILLLSNRFFTSEYIRQHELPYLMQQAEAKALRLASLYVTTIPREAFMVPLQVDGQQRTIDLQAYLGAHNPREPLNTLDQGQRDAIYTRVTERVTQWLDPIPAMPPRRSGPRFELAIMLHARRDYWEHRFSLPQAPDFARPALDCPTPEMLFRYPGYTVDGEDLFQLLFGSDEILGAAFGGLPAADPMRYPLRVRLLTDDARLRALPWATIAYQGRRLASDG